MSLSGHEIRQQFLDFFVHQPQGAHRLVAPAPLIPPDDPTLLFTSAGMVQFKSLYTGDIDPLPYTRAASCQPCLRAGGKGSDLENVGKTLRHHTLFEMLGNFSFGDYFKREAIRWAWEFVTKNLGLPPERLFPTIFDEDDEAEKLWREETDCHYTPVRLDAKQNFWGPAGDTGACGPCSELCFFMGSDAELQDIRRKLKESESAMMPELRRRIDEEGDVFLEIWNMVFPQFDQQRDGTRLPLKNRGIDTGAGLERMTTAKLWLDGKASTPYETDLLQPIVQAAAAQLGVTYERMTGDPAKDAASARVRLAVNAITDHTRALVFCLAEGITPGNVGRGYVIRRIQRRALRFASLLGKDGAFMASLVDPVVDTMGATYPHLKERAAFVSKALRLEEEAFLKTRNRGMKLLDELIDQARHSGSSAIPGAEAFKLWDTYGFPVDLTREIAEDAGLAIEQVGYDEALQAQRERGRASWQGAKLSADAHAAEALFEKHGATKFLGYAGTSADNLRVLAIVQDGKLIESASVGTEVTMILDRTPFYAESGGQVGDTGLCKGEGVAVTVLDTQKTGDGLFLHRALVEDGELRAGAVLSGEVDAARRLAIQRNHTSTHLLQAALKKHVGAHVSQAGSYVGPEGLRFDFTHSEGLSAETLRQLQEEVNALILRDAEVVTEVLPLEEARKRGAIAPFGEKYGHEVRVVQVGQGADMSSLEFCGGTHLQRTSQAGHFRILGEGSISAGVRRIEAVTGAEAVRLEAEEQYGVVAPLQSALAAKGHGLVERVEQLSERVRQLEKQLAAERQKAALGQVDALAAKATDFEGFKLASALVDNLSGNDLRTLAMALREKLGERAIAVLASRTDGKVALIAAVGKEAQGRFPAGMVVNALAEPLGGKGGGKPDLAQAGAKDASGVEQVLSGLPQRLAGMA